MHRKWALREKFTTQRFSIQIRTTETKPNPNPNPNTNPNPPNPNPTDPTIPYHLMVYMVLGGELLQERPESVCTEIVLYRKRPTGSPSSHSFTIIRSFQMTSLNISCTFHYVPRTA